MPLRNLALHDAYRLIEQYLHDQLQARWPSGLLKPSPGLTYAHTVRLLADGNFSAAQLENIFYGLQRVVEDCQLEHTSLAMAYNHARSLLGLNRF